MSPAQTDTAPVPGFDKSPRDQGQPPLRLLIVDDEEIFARALALLLQRRQAEVVVAHDGGAGLRLAQSQPFDVVLLDHVLPDCRGLQLLPSFLSLRPAPLVIVMTAYGTVDDAVEAMRLGAHDYASKGADVRSIVERVQRARRLVAVRRQQPPTQVTEPPLLGRSAAMMEVRHRLQRVAKSPETTVLITGETGTGKELAARTLHALGAVQQPFVAVDCVSLPHTLAESELFGHEKGAYTGAERSRPGRLEAAGQGTVLLDEIGDMDLGLQAKLLRVLESRTITRLGGHQPLPLQARVLAATNTDLAQRVAEGSFRLDLFHRLSVFQVTMPPLRERREDIPLLAQHFIQELAERLGRPPAVLTGPASARLQAYDYPGNVRELRNVLEQALIMVDDEQIDVVHLPDRLAELQGLLPSPKTSDRRPGLLVEFRPGEDSLADVEQRLIAQVMELAQGRISKAAELLGISRFALARRLEKNRQAPRAGPSVSGGAFLAGAVAGSRTTQRRRRQP
jgi:two-component system response regulator AtoC